VADASKPDTAGMFADRAIVSSITALRKFPEGKIVAERDAKQRQSCATTEKICLPKELLLYEQLTDSMRLRRYQ
jgi:hypothetical protein